MLHSTWIRKLFISSILVCGTTLAQQRADLQQLQEGPPVPFAYVETTVDGVAYLPIADMLELLPHLRGMPSNGLHLRRRGNKVAYAIIDTNGYLDDSDTLFFVGTHPVGDTTYFSAYSSVAAFELWYDGALPSLRLHHDTSESGFPSVREHLWIERHLEEEHQYIQGWLDAERYTQTNSTFVTETVPGERWAWAVVYPSQPFRTVLLTAPDPARNDSVIVKLFYSSIDNDIYTNPDNRLLLWYGGLPRDSAIYDGPRDSVLTVVINPRRDGCISDTLALTNRAVTTAAQAIDYITTQGYEYAVACRDRLAGTCFSAMPEQLIMTNFSSPRVVVIDTVAMRWGIWQGERGVLFRIAARSMPERQNISVGDTAMVVTRSRFAIAWLDQSSTVQLFTENDPTALAAFLSMLDVGTPFAITVSNGGFLNNQLRARLEAEGSTLIGNVGVQQPYVAVGIRGNRSLFRESTGDGATALIAWLPTERGNAYRVFVPLDSGGHSLVATGALAWERARIRLSGGEDLHADTNRADYLIITHPNFRSAAERLARYRSVRNNIRARVVGVEDIFDAFGHGEKSPHAIKAFLQYAYRRWQKPAPSAVVLVGDASWDPRKISAGAVNDDFVPSYGKPVSDFWYVLLEGNDYVPQMSIGRIPVRTLQQADAVVDKIIEYDTLPWQQWQKRFLFITGGADANEQFDFYQSVLYSFVPLLVEPMQRALCADTMTVSFYAGTSSGLPLPAAIVNAINQGTVWINYIGHGSPRTLEVAGWEAERLSNRGRYPILASFSCQIGAFAEPTVSALGEDFLLHPQAGMIAVIATTGFGIRAYDDILNSGLFAVLARTRTRTLGELLNQAKSYLNDGSQIAINTIMQTTLLGDPLLRVPIDTLPRPVLDLPSVRLTTIPPASILDANADSIRIEATVFNAGIHADSSFAIRLVRHYGNIHDTSSVSVTDLCYPQPVQFTLPVRDMPGEHRVQFEIDPDRNLGQPLPTYEMSFYVYAEQLYAVEPQPGWNIAPYDTVVRFLNPFALHTPFEYQAHVLSSSGDTLATSYSTHFRQLPTHCEWHLPIQLQAGNEYRFILRAYNTVRKAWTPWLVLPVVVTDTTLPNQVLHMQGMHSGWQRSSISGMELDSNAVLTFSSHVNAELMSAGGYQYSERDTVHVTIHPAYRLRIGGTNLATERSDEVGVHVVVLASEDATVRTVRWYSTWTTTPISRSWGDAAALINFLRDSVDSHDYVVLVSCGPAWSLAFRRYAEEFGRLLSEFGARKVDMLSDNRSYIFVGMRSSERPFVFEQVNDDTQWGGGDTVAAVLTLPLFPRAAYVELPVAGPASKWEDLRLDHQCSFPIRLEIYGGDSPGKTTALVATDSSAELSLANIPADRYPYLRVVYTILRDSGSFRPCSIERALLRYVPMPELVCSVAVDHPFPLRGDTLNATAIVFNVVSRSTNDKGTAAWHLRTHDGLPIHAETIPDTALSIPLATPLTARIPTLLLPSSCFVQFEVASPRDLFSFNNIATASFSVRQDTVPPAILLYAGTERVYDTAIVAAATTLYCAMLDSAQVAITDSTALILRLNGVRLPTASTRYVFYPTNQVLSHTRWRDEPLTRAAVEVDVSLERGVNLLLVTARDAFGNVTTARFTLIVPNSLVLDSPIIMPNPAQYGERVHLRVIYRGFEQAVTGRLELYDVLGRRVRSDTSPLTVGHNDIVIPLTDQQSGELLQSGMYFWRLWLEAVGSNDAISGVIAVVR